MRRVFLLAAVAAGLLAPTPAGATVAATIRLTISHVVSNCHVWTTPSKQLGATARIVVREGDRMTLRIDCPMDFDFTQVAGPRLALGSPRTFGGQSRTIVFRRAGTYRLRAKNVQTPEERGLDTLGRPNTLTLTVVVRPRG